MTATGAKLPRALSTLELCRQRLGRNLKAQQCVANSVANCTSIAE